MFDDSLDNGISVPLPIHPPCVVRLDHRKSQGNARLREVPGLLKSLVIHGNFDVLTGIQDAWFSAAG